jgi:hypothetical protein
MDAIHLATVEAAAAGWKELAMRLERENRELLAVLNELWGEVKENYESRSSSEYYPLPDLEQRIINALAQHSLDGTAPRP